MCLVEMEKSAKPIASCAMPAADGMNIKTNTEFVSKARKRGITRYVNNIRYAATICAKGNGKGTCASFRA